MANPTSPDSKYFWYLADSRFQNDFWWLSISGDPAQLSKISKRTSAIEAADQHRQMRELLIIEEAREMQQKVEAESLHPLPRRVCKTRQPTAPIKDEVALFQIDQA